MKINKASFIFILDSILEQMEINRKAEELLRKIYIDFQGLVKTPLIDNAVKFLDDCVGYELDYEIIAYYVFELDFGRSESHYKEGSPIKLESGKEIPFRTSEDVYNHIIS